MGGLSHESLENGNDQPHSLEPARSCYTSVQELLTCAMRSTENKTMLQTRSVHSAVVLSIVYLLSGPNTETRSHEQTSIDISVVDYPRPVAEAVRQVERHFGYVITYEDVRYLHPSDIVDVTARVRRDGKQNPCVFGMRNGTIAFTFMPRPGNTGAQVGEVLQEILIRSRGAGNAGDFWTELTQGGYHVVPVSTRGKSGSIEAFESALDTRITMSPRDETGLEMMRRFVDTVSAAWGQKLDPGTMPMSQLDRARVRVEARNDRARDVLWRALQGISPTLSWQLFCGVGDEACALNIHRVLKTSRRS
jgi:hypothetical protein